MRAALGVGVLAGLSFSAVRIAFVPIGLFTDIPRPTWSVLDNVKGAIGFGMLGWAGLVVGRRTRRPLSGAAAGALGGLIAGVTVPASMYVLAYGFVDAVRQYPFEYHDYLSSGAASVQAFLRSPEGHATVHGTSLGLVPIVAAIGYVGGCIGRWRSGPAPAAARALVPQRG